MALGYILRRIGQKMGMNPSDARERQVLLDYANEAARELYSQGDLPGSLKEAVFQVSGDKQLTLPTYVYAPRAMREVDDINDWKLVNMLPRFARNAWLNEWKNFRLKGIVPIERNIENAGAITIESYALEAVPYPIITIVGSTETASRVAEQVTLDSETKVTTTSFREIFSISKDKVTQYDIVIKDIDDRQLASIPNNVLESRYSLVDVSLYPFTSDPNAGEQYMEVLYKERLPDLVSDTDEFPAPDYDDVIVNKVLQLWAEEQEKGDAALAWDAKATRTATRISDDKERAQEQVVTFAPNFHDEIHRKTTPRDYNQ